MKTVNFQLRSVQNTQWRTSKRVSEFTTLVDLAWGLGVDASKQSGLGAPFASVSKLTAKGILPAS